MKKIDKAIGVVAAILVLGLVLSTLFFRGNVDEWAATLSKLSQDDRALAGELRETATEAFRSNPDGFYKFEGTQRTQIRYYLFWRVWADPEELPDHITSQIAGSLVSASLEAVGEAASMTASVYGWDRKFGNRVSKWLEANGVDKMDVDLFIRVNGTWRAAGALPREDNAKAVGDEELAAIGDGRFNRIIVVR